jgi:hypothetical protein
MWEISAGASLGVADGESDDLPDGVKDVAADGLVNGATDGMVAGVTVGGQVNALGNLYYQYIGGSRSWEWVTLSRERDAPQANFLTTFCSSNRVTVNRKTMSVPFRVYSTSNKQKSSYTLPSNQQSWISWDRASRSEEDPFPWHLQDLFWQSASALFHPL